MRHRLTLLLLLPLLVGGGPAVALQGPPPASPPAPSADERPDLLDSVAFEQRVGEELPLELRFRDAEGREVGLGDIFGSRPVILAPVYFRCPMLCGLVLSGLSSALKVVGLEPGRDFDVVVVSFNPRETPEEAAEAKRTTLERYGRPETAGGWHFLTGDEEAIRRLTESIGFRYTWDPETQQYVHASGIVLVTPEGRLARYHLGVEFAPRDLRLGLVEAAAGRIGSVVDQVLLYCFRYNPSTGRYSAVTMNIVRLAGAVTVLGLGLFIVLALLRERRKRAGKGQHAG